MKIGTVLRAFTYFGDDGYKKLADIGYGAVDFNLGTEDHIIHTASEDDVTEYLLRHKELAREAGIEISQAHGPWRFPTKDATEEDRADRMARMKRSIHACSVLGCDNWIIHPIMPFTHSTPEDKYEETWNLNLKFMRELLSYAKEQGVTICFENMPFKFFPISRPEEILKFVKEINDDHFKICLDTGHVSIYEDLNAGDAARLFGSEIRTLHVHDNNGKADQHAAPFYGIINWQDFRLALEEINYKGVFSLETAPPQNMPADAFEAMLRAYYITAKSIID